MAFPSVYRHVGYRVIFSRRLEEILLLLLLPLLIEGKYTTTTDITTATTATTTTATTTTTTNIAATTTAAVHEKSKTLNNQDTVETSLRHTLRMQFVEILRKHNETGPRKTSGYPNTRGCPGTRVPVALLPAGIQVAHYPLIGWGPTRYTRWVPG